ncbi:hypothetical protein ACHQM5_002856 [Ranunculus cassubicifolius]
MYGFLPCAVNVWGYLFLIVVYQFLLYLGESYVSRGSDLMFTLLGPGIFGASAFQILGVLPQVALILASGISGSKETAQAQVMSGMAVSVGSTVFLLTLLWGTCVVAGKVDLSVESKSVDTESLNPLKSLGSGITTDTETRYTARIMLLSVIPFIIAQLPHVLGSSSSGSLATLIALIVSVSFLFIYCFYQVFQPWIQNKRLDYLKQKFVRKVLLDKLRSDGGIPNTQVIAELFTKIDQNNNNFVTVAELKGLILGIQFQEVGLYEEDFVDTVMKEFDASGDTLIDKKEFIRGISKWLSDKKSNESSQETNHETSNVYTSFWRYVQAASLLVLGTTMIVFLATPLIRTVVSFASAVNVPSIYVSYIMVPMVVNFRRARAAIRAIRKRRSQSASLTLSMIYSAAFMNNIVGVSAFLGIVYARSLVWDFSAEVLVVVIVCLVMGLYTSFYKTFPLWACFIAYLMYPLSLMLLYVLTYTYGWD